MLPGTGRLLERIAQRVRLLAVLSGRPTAFLRDHIRCPEVELYGSYGLETDPTSAPWLAAVRWATARLAARFDGHDGIKVEPKAASVAVHWRTAEDRRAAEKIVTEIVDGLAGQTGLRAEPSKMMLELRPPTTVDKGTTLARLVAERGLRTVVYAGDDIVDQPALAYARAVGGHALLVEQGTETPQDLVDLATERFTGVEAFHKWLAALTG